MPVFAVFPYPKGGVFLLLSLENIVHYVQDRCLLNIDNLKIFEGDRIGVVGRNGVGKSTLLGIMAGTVEPDAGRVIRNGACSYLPQLEAGLQSGREMDGSLFKKFGSRQEYHKAMSGGEKMRYRLAVALSEGNPLLLADEPTANLDINGTELLQSMLQEYPGALVLVSHDRQLLDAVCNIIWEITDSRVKVYPGNYSDYYRQKEVERRREEREYENYIRKKEHLEQAIADRKSRNVSMRKTPKRMGNSEARLHKMGNQKAKANLDKAVKAIESRLAKLEVKTRPKTAPAVNFELNAAESEFSKIVIRGENVQKNFGERVLFCDLNFSIQRSQKVALFGKNGCGKTTLLKMIANGDDGIYVSPNARLGYFDQELQNLDPDQSILANVMADSVRDEGFVRNFLARLLFRRDDVYKKVAVISGGERVRVALAKIMVGEANVLLLDEPTNYLDLPSIEALESVLSDYDGTLLFASHDRQFINKVATHLMVFEQGGIRMFEGNYDQYREAGQAEETQYRQNPEDRMVLENRLAEVLGKLSVAKDPDEYARWDEEYRRLLRMKGDR